MGLSDHPRAVFTGGSAHLHPPKTPTSPLEAGSPISQPGLQVPSAEAGFELQTGTSEAPSPGVFSRSPSIGSANARVSEGATTHILSRTHAHPRWPCLTHTRTHTSVPGPCTRTDHAHRHTPTHARTWDWGGVPSAEEELRREGSYLQLCLPSPHVLTPDPGCHPKNGAVQFLRKKKKLKQKKTKSMRRRSASSRPPRGFVS